MTDVPDPAVPPGDARSDVEAVSALADPVRRGLYGFVRRARRPVTREEAAADAGISAKLAAFHLDKLVAAGLLRSGYGAPGGEPRVGRRPKVYERAETQVRVSIPERRPDVLAEILLDAVAGHQIGEDAGDCALRAARRHGEDIGAAARAASSPGRLGPERSVTLVRSVLERYGFEPDRPAPAELRLLNCPFHPLAARSPELVCGMNHAFVCGLLAGLRTGGVQAVLAPAPDRCCVQVRAQDRTEPDACRRPEPRADGRRDSGPAPRAASTVDRKEKYNDGATEAVRDRRSGPGRGEGGPAPA